MSRRFWRRIRGLDKAIISRYLDDHPVRKLHVGCGKNLLSGWLNADLAPRREDVLDLDATGRFPFSDGVFDYVFSEHMIEHIPYPSGLSMLSECHRILRPGGRLRISTPDIRFLIDLYSDDKSELQRQYIDWAVDRFIEHAPRNEAIFVINNFVRGWGHQFIYDEKTLRRAMEAVGLTGIVRCELNESDDELLRNLENEQRMPAGFLRLESFTLEGTRGA